MVDPSGRAVHAFEDLPQIPPLLRQMEDPRFQPHVPGEEQDVQGEKIEEGIEDEHDVLRDVRSFGFRLFRPLSEDPLKREHQDEIHEQDDQPADDEKPDPPETVPRGQKFIFRRICFLHSVLQADLNLLPAPFAYLTNAYIFLLLQGFHAPRSL